MAATQPRTGYLSIRYVHTEKNRAHTHTCYSIAVCCDETLEQFHPSNQSFWQRVEPDQWMITTRSSLTHSRSFPHWRLRRRTYSFGISRRKRSQRSSTPALPSVRWSFLLQGSLDRSLRLFFTIALNGVWLPLLGTFIPFLEVSWSHEPNTRTLTRTVKHKRARAREPEIGTGPEVATKQQQQAGQRTR